MKNHNQNMEHIMERYIGLWIKEINRDIEKDGLTENVIRKEIEGVLSREGIKLLSKKESSANPNWQIQGEPGLRICPRIIKNMENRYVFRINMEFEQRCGQRSINDNRHSQLFEFNLICH